jgi:hypothetical protein
VIVTIGALVVIFTLPYSLFYGHLDLVGLTALGFRQEDTKCGVILRKPHQKTTTPCIFIKRWIFLQLVVSFAIDVITEPPQRRTSLISSCISSRASVCRSSSVLLIGLSSTVLLSA